MTEQDPRVLAGKAKTYMAFNIEGETVYCHLTEEQLRTIYKRFGHPLAVHDLGTNFNSATFRGYFKSISSTLKQMLVEAYYSVGLVERYYVLVRRAFEIVIKELLKALREDRLQMAIKAINDIAGLNGLVLILFVFGTLSKLTEQDRLAAFI
ncbi:hypothetical protein MBM_07861 [Drepanopeziza brunnea f. sp. 'multigermtubi' MB_m1]|uniref:Uncharacterized protein n=1 Tax=Marssonina brunnea f. sp. multigermtubi (strain MB_m1) TaxID=1072389 RepID=K1XP01_MARBU|nr:uncharacterized protein MBM_07861 [Drepanopeziza brunnea f. sp. 'multigermtubi' MB_m1]EKD14184.1 hypothetical protein MBM_07861 [Drepanopeziza brunnea f. sp. 'multigermtubi' MB_m1]